MHRVPSFYTFEPLIMDDYGTLMPSCYGSLALYLNDQYTSIPAALEALGAEPQPIPAII